MIWLILALGLALRLINLNQSFWLDEATQALLSRESINSILFDRTQDFHPPLYYLFIHFWMMLSNSETWLRLPSVLAGVITIWITYLISRILFSQRIALTAAFLLAISQYHIYYSQELRMYSLATLLVSFSSYFLVTKRWWWYLICISLLIWSHYVGIFIILAHLFYIVSNDKPEVKRFLLVLGGIGISYLAWIPQLLIQLRGGVDIDSYLPGWREILGLSYLKAIPLTIFKFTFGRVDFDNPIFYSCLIGITLMIVAGLSMITFIKIRSKEINLVWLWFLIPLFGSWLISFITPLNQPFRILFILPALLIIFSVAINNLPKYKYLALGVLTFFSITSLTMYYLNPKFQREDWRGAVEYLNSQKSPSMVVFVWPEPFPPYLWYRGPNSSIGLTESFPVQFETVDYKMRNIKENRIYIFDYLQDLSDPSRVTLKWLEDNGYNAREIKDFNGIGFIRHYYK